jgi:hypothetical protein
MNRMFGGAVGCQPDIPLGEHLQVAAATLRVYASVKPILTPVEILHVQNNLSPIWRHTYFQDRWLGDQPFSMAVLRNSASD